MLATDVPRSPSQNPHKRPPHSVDYPVNPPDPHPKPTLAVPVHPEPVRPPPRSIYPQHPTLPSVPVGPHTSMQSRINSVVPLPMVLAGGRLVKDPRGAPLAVLLPPTRPKSSQNELPVGVHYILSGYSNPPSSPRHQMRPNMIPAVL